MNKRQTIWEAYRTYKMLAFVTRAGFGTCGIYPFDPEEEIPKKGQGVFRSESDLEHVAGMSFLIRAISWHYPKIIPHELIDDYLYGAEIHEIGELLTGDTLDDGRRNEKEKDFLEASEIRKFLYTYAEFNEYKHGYNIYEQMRDKNTDFGKTLYLIDKLEAVLQAILYESLGSPGLLSKKEERFGMISKRDKELSEIVGSNNISDTWAYGFIMKAQELEYEYTDIFAAIIHEAILEVRGKPFSWMKIE